MKEKAQIIRVKPVQKMFLLMILMSRMQKIKFHKINNLMMKKEDRADFLRSRKNMRSYQI